MKKVLISLVMLGLFILAGISTTAETIEKDKGYISVNKSTSREVSPNQAEISIGIETSDKSLQKASEENKRRANNVYASLKALLSTEDYIKTCNYSARPQYIWTKDNQKIFDKYIVTNTVVIRTKKIELVSKLIDTAIAQGATNVENLQFLATDYDSSCNAVLAELTKTAYAQAISVAKSVNSQITGIKSISTSCNSESTPRPMYAMTMKNAMDTVGSATPIEGGKIRIFASVDASFYVK